MTDRLPDGFTIRLRADLLRAKDPGVLVGGSPLRVVRLSPKALGLFAGPDGRDLTVRGAASAALARRLLAGNLADPVLNTPPVAASELTVVVPTRDRSEELDRCLSALAEPGLRVLVVDDASHAPGLVAQVARRHGAEVVALPANLGPAGARNAGLAQVRTDLVAFVDSDVVIAGRELLGLARHLVDPKVALVGPRVVGDTSAPRPSWWQRYDVAASSLDVGPRSGLVASGTALGWLPSACLVGRTAVLQAGFDARMRVAEDVDLVWRLGYGGHHVRYDAEVIARHEVRGTITGWLGRKRVYGSGAADLYRRHGDQTAPAVLAPATAVAGWALLQRRGWSLPVAGLAALLVARRVGASLPDQAATWPVTGRLAARSVAWATRQQAGLLLRDWWPMTVFGLGFSPTLRRVVSTALIVDYAVQWHTEGRAPTPSRVLARRLSDLAYGAGLWQGVLATHDPGPLKPRWVVG